MRSAILALMIVARLGAAQGITLHTVDTMQVGAGSSVQAFLADKQGRVVRPVSTGTILWRSTSNVLRITKVRTGAVDFTAERVGTGSIVASWWNQGRTWFDTVRIVVTLVNARPVARATARCEPGSCWLSSESSDPDNDPITLLWRSPGPGHPESTALGFDRLYGTTLNEFTQWLVVTDSRGGVDSAAVGVIIPPPRDPYSLTMSATRDTVLQRPAPNQSDGTHFTIVQATPVSAAGEPQPATEVVYTVSDTLAATFTRNATNGSLMVSDPTKNATVTVTAQYTRDSFTAQAQYILVLRLRAQVPTTVQVALDNSNLRAGDTTMARTAVLDQWGALLSGRVIEWGTSDASVFIVNGAGRVIALREGVALLWARTGGVEGSVSVAVGPAPVHSLEVGFDYTTKVLWPAGYAAFPEAGVTLCAEVVRATGERLLGSVAIQAFIQKQDSVSFQPRTETGAALRDLCRVVFPDVDTSQIVPVEWGVDRLNPWGVSVWLPVVAAKPPLQ